MGTYFFSGIGGVGVLPLAQILSSQGHHIVWSDRDHDLGRLPEKYAYMKKVWPDAYPQDGSGVRALAGSLVGVVPSGSVEAKVADLEAARELNVPVIRRPEVLSTLFGAARMNVGVAGTSGKTTVTGMIGYLLQEMGENPTVMNGGIFRNYAADNPWCSALTGRPELFVTEVDESDGSIALYRPKVAVLTNIGLDHKPLAELNVLFGDFLAKAPACAINVDDPAVRALAPRCRGRCLGFGLDWPAARLTAEDIRQRPDGSDSTLLDRLSGARWPLSLQVPGRYNIANALAALTVLEALGLDMARGAALLAGFTGIRRRLEVAGTSPGGVTVIDDFAHNPDKVAATLSTLREFPGRLLVMFQPHGFGPLKFMRRELVDSFVKHLGPADELFMPEPFYAGGTTDRSISSRDVVADLVARGIRSHAYPDRDSLTGPLLAASRPGDRIVVMGARDETLGDYARNLLKRLTVA